MPHPTQDSRPFEIGDQIQVSIPGCTFPGRIVGRWDYESCATTFRVRASRITVNSFIERLRPLALHFHATPDDESEIEIDFAPEHLIAA